MSIERESVLIIGVELSNEDVIDKMKSSNAPEWNDDFFNRNEGYHALIGENLAEEYGFSHFYREEYVQPHVIGISLDNCLLIDNDNLDIIKQKALKVTEKMGIEAKLISLIYEY